MTAHDIEVGLIQILNDCSERDEYEITDDATAKSFKDAGMMQSDHGLVLKVGGDEFQISIVQVKRQQAR